MAAFEVIALDTATPQLRAPGAADTYTFPRAVEMPLGTANGVLYLNGSKVVSSGSGLTFDGTNLATTGTSTGLRLIASSTDAGGSVLQIDTTATAYGRVGGSTTMGYVAGTQSLWTIGGNEQMRLTSTGLGIGTSSPGAKLHTVGASGALLENTAGGFFQQIGFRSGVSTFAYYDSLEFGYATAQGFSGYTATMRLTSSGNLGLGVTPSAWGSNFKAIQGFSSSQFGLVASTNSVAIGTNYYHNNTDYLYATTGQSASRYDMTSAGVHRWFTAPSGTAGNAISFTQAMTLDASGNLGIGTTSPLARLHLNDASGGDVPRIRITNGVTGTGATDGMFVGISNSSQLDVWNFENNSIRFATNNAIRAEITGSGNVVIGEAAIPTNATNAFLYVPGCAGTPTGTPTAYTGRVPIVVDTTNNKLYFYSGGAWRDAGP
jgi:hypothetical protein